MLGGVERSACRGRRAERVSRAASGARVAGDTSSVFRVPYLSSRTEQRSAALSGGTGPLRHQRVLLLLSSSFVLERSTHRPASASARRQLRDSAAQEPWEGDEGHKQRSTTMALIFHVNISNKWGHVLSDKGVWQGWGTC